MDLTKSLPKFDNENFFTVCYQCKICIKIFILILIYLCPIFSSRQLKTLKRMFENSNSEHTIITLVNITPISKLFYLDKTKTLYDTTRCMTPNLFKYKFQIQKRFYVRSMVESFETRIVSSSKFK